MREEDVDGEFDFYRGKHRELGYLSPYGSLGR
jgi:hypothetical protein